MLKETEKLKKRVEVREHPPLPSPHFGSSAHRLNPENCSVNRRVVPVSPFGVHNFDFRSAHTQWAMGRAKFVLYDGKKRNLQKALGCFLAGSLWRYRYPTYITAFRPNKLSKALVRSFAAPVFSVPRCKHP